MIVARTPRHAERVFARTRNPCWHSYLQLEVDPRMPSETKATRLSLLEFSTSAMRAFHMTWIAFFLCFFAWFGIAPLMVVVREELQLTKDQVGWCIIGSVAVTIFARLLVGWLCDRIGPRLTYTGLLLVGSIPVMAIGADSVPMSLEQAQGRARFAKEKMDAADEKLRTAESQDKSAFKQVQTKQKRMEEAQRAYEEAKASAELATQQLRDAQTEATQSRARYEEARQQLKAVYQEMESTRKQAQ